MPKARSKEETKEEGMSKPQNWVRKIDETKREQGEQQNEQTKAEGQGDQKEKENTRQTLARGKKKVSTTHGWEEGKIDLTRSPTLNTTIWLHPNQVDICLKEAHIKLDQCQKISIVQSDEIARANEELMGVVEASQRIVRPTLHISISPTLDMLHKVNHI